MRLRNLLVYLCFAILPAFAQWGGELHLALRNDPSTFNPALVDEESGELIRYLTGGVLVRVNRATQELEPALAASWKVLEGGRAVRFQLRAGVAFSDGTPFTPDDVVYTIETLMSPELHSPVGDSLRTGEAPAKATAEGAHTVTIRFAAPLAAGVRVFDQVCIQSRRSALKELAVLGPFRLAEHKPGISVRLERNPNYWRSANGRKLPYLDSIRLDILQNRDLEFLRFQRGQLHAISYLLPDQFEELARTSPGLARDAGESLENEFVWFNMTPSAPIPAHEKLWFNSRNFRLAVSHAIRRGDLCRVVYHNHAVPGVGPVPPVNKYWFNQRLKPHSFDLSLSRRLLAEDGFRFDSGTLRDKSGHAVEFSLITNAGNAARARMASMIQQDLAAIGIRLNIVTLDFPSLLERISKSFAYEACLLGFNNVDLDPGGQMNLWLSSAANHAWNPRQAAPATAWEAEIDRLMREQAYAADGSKRKALFDRVQEIVSREAPIVYLLNRNALVAARPELAQLKPSALAPRLVWNIDEIQLRTAR